MSTGVTSHTTAAVEPSRSFEYWRHLISDTFVPLTADPVGPWDVPGHIRHSRHAELDVSTVRACGQHVRRTPALIARSDDAYVLASIQTAGHGVVVQDGRRASLRPGDVAFYDSTRPYTLHFDGAFEQIVVQLPLPHAALVAGVRDVATATARAVPSPSVARTVADFFASFTAAAAADPAGAGALAPAGGMLLAAALAVCSGSDHAADGGRQRRHTQAVDVLRRRLHEATLTVDAVAEELHVSRRTLYRSFEDEPDGLIGLLRRLRVERARHLLRTHPALPVAAVAQACGFAGQVQFHRVFRQVTGTTPAGFREDGTQR